MKEKLLRNTMKVIILIGFIIAIYSAVKLAKLLPI